MGINHFPMSSGMREWMSECVSQRMSVAERASKVISVERANEWKVQANQQTKKWIAQYSTRCNHSQSTHRVPWWSNAKAQEWYWLIDWVGDCAVIVMMMKKVVVLVVENLPLLMVVVVLRTVGRTDGHTLLQRWCQSTCSMFMNTVGSFCRCLYDSTQQRGHNAQMVCTNWLSTYEFSDTAKTSIGWSCSAQKRSRVVRMSHFISSETENRVRTMAHCTMIAKKWKKWPPKKSIFCL